MAKKKKRDLNGLVVAGLIAVAVFAFAGQGDYGVVDVTAESNDLAERVELLERNVNSIKRYLVGISKLEENLGVIREYLDTLPAEISSLKDALAEEEVVVPDNL